MFFPLTADGSNFFQPFGALYLLVKMILRMAVELAFACGRIVENCTAITRRSIGKMPACHRQHFCKEPRPDAVDMTGCLL